MQYTNENTDKKHDYLKESGWIILAFSSLFYYIALMSHDVFDPSYYSVSSPEITTVSNSAGKFGAEISAHLLTWFGASAYLIPVFMGLCYFGIYKTAGNLNKYFAVITFFTQITVFSALLSLISSLVSEDNLGGGWLGSDLSQLAVNNFGEAGSWIVIVPLVFIIFSFKTKQSFLTGIVLKARSKLPNITIKLPTFVSKSNKEKSRELRVTDNSQETFGTQSTEGPVVDLPKQENTKSSLVSFFKKKEPTHDDHPVVIEAEALTNCVPLDEINQNSFHSLMEKQLWEGNLPATIDYKIPSTEIFKSSSSEGVTSISDLEMKEVGELLTKTLLDFGVTGKIIGYQPGPVVTVYEFQPDAGIKQSKITGLIDDIALSLKVDSILIQPVKGKRALGVQVPNSNRQVVFFGDLVTSNNFKVAPSPLTFAMGKALDGKPVVTDLTGMPHLLVAGATGSGKSVGINSLICSVVMKASPAEVRMILVDPKMLELSVYEGIPHLLMPVITEAAKASLALRWAVNEMERRYKIMQTVQVRNIQAFNAFWKKQTEEQKQEIRDKVGDQEIDHLPFILLVIDELADLMLTAPKEVESVIQRLAQKARASGIHMVLATQRPSVDIITGVIKANLPSRIAFQVVSKHDSRTILDQMGADKLLGKGDMLFQKPGISKIDRIQGAFVSDEEVVNLVNQIKEDHSTSYNEDLIDWIENEASKQDSPSQGGGIEFDDDPKWDDAITIAQGNGQISASFLQRQLKIGYNRAARIVESMEGQGLVDKASGSKPRKWIGPQETALSHSSLIED